MQQRVPSDLNPDPNPDWQEPTVRKDATFERVKVRGGAQLDQDDLDSD